MNATPVRSPLTDQRAFSVSAKREATEFRGTKCSPSAPSTPVGIYTPDLSTSFENYDIRQRDSAYKTPDSKLKTSSTRSPRTSTSPTSSPVCILFFQTAFLPQRCLTFRPNVASRPRHPSQSIMLLLFHRRLLCLSSCEGVMISIFGTTE